MSVTWDLALGTAFTLRLILWLSWNKLSIIAGVKRSLENIKTIVITLSTSGVSSSRILLKDNLEFYLVHYFGTTDVWNFNMSDMMRHKIFCGNTGDGDPPGRKLGRVHIDNACVTIDNNPGIRVLAQNSECFGCPLLPVWQPHSDPAKHINASFQVDNTEGLLSDFDKLFCVEVQTRYPTQLEVEYLNNSAVCRTSHHFEQFGVYHLNLTDCDISIQTR